MSASPSSARSPASSAGLITAVAVGVTIVSWASAFPAIRAGVAHFGPFELGAIRFAIAAAPAALFLLLTRPALPARADIWRFAFGGLFHVALYTVLMNAGEMTVSAGAASFIVNVNPIITAALAVMILGERFGARAWSGALLSFAGIGLIAFGDGGGLDLGLGALMIFGSACCQAFTTIVQKPLFSRHAALTVSASNMVIGAVCLAPWLPSAWAQAATAAPQPLWAAIYLGIVPSLIAYASWTVALSRLPAARASNWMFCVPPVAVAMGWLWLGEQPTPLTLIGGVMTLAGVLIVNLKR